MAGLLRPSDLGEVGLVVLEPVTCDRLGSAPGALWVGRPRVGIDDAGGLSAGDEPLDEGRGTAVVPLRRTTTLDGRLGLVEPIVEPIVGPPAGPG